MQFIRLLLSLKSHFLEKMSKLSILAPKIILTEFSSQFHRLSKFSQHFLNFNQKNSVFEIIRKKVILFTEISLE